MRRTLDFAATGPASAGRVDGSAHEFTASVELGDADLDDRVLLEVHGIATVYDVLVNGALVCSDTSMFARHVLDVSHAVSVGRNDVRIRCRPLSEALDALPRKPRARWRTMLVDEPRLRWLRTTVLGRAPGFAAEHPVVGPWRPVVLETRAPVRVEELRLMPSVVDASGVLDVEVRATGAERLSLDLDGPQGRVSADIVLADGRGSARLVVADVARWWPHTHGTPVLHDVRLRHGERVLDLPGDGTGPADVRRVGFRALGNGSTDGRPDPGEESLALRVNGVPVFCRGVVWTPGDPAALDRAVELGFNLVRVSGISAYESDAFHARCDELGLLVWQDLMFATFDYPLADPGFVSVVEAEVADQATRLLGHPSTVVVCGSAEHQQQAAMFGVRPDTGYATELGALLRPLVEGAGLDAIWVDSTPCGGNPATRVDIGIAQYFGVGAYLRELPDVRHSRVRFAAECLAFAHLPDPVVEGGVPADNGADWDFADVREHYARQRYGADAGVAERQRVSGEVMADVFGEWRRPESGCGGGIVLWLRDLEPGAGWGLLDHEGRVKPAATALAPVLRPTAVWFVDEGVNGLDVHVAHDGPEGFAAVLRVDLLREDGSVVDGAESAWEMAPHGHRVLGVDALLGRFADSSYAYRFGPRSFAAVRAVLSDGSEVLVETLRT